MKKSKLRPINKKALKAVAITAVVGTLGAQAIMQRTNRIKEEQLLNDFKDELIEYKTTQNQGQTTTTEDAPNQMETIEISKKFPRIAIIYHDNGEITIMFDREYLSLEAAMEKYPDVTNSLRKYINPKDVTPNQTTIRLIMNETENTLEK